MVIACCFKVIDRRFFEGKIYRVYNWEGLPLKRHGYLSLSHAVVQTVYITKALKVHFQIWFV